MDFLEDFSNKTDEEIIGLALDNQELFLHIVKRYKTKLFNYIRRISSVSPEEAEDILQNVFLKAYLNINDFDRDMKFSSWIYRIAHNETISNFRKKRARPEIIDLDIDDERLKFLAHDFDIEKEVDRKYLKKDIGTTLEELEDNYKEILILKFLEDKDYNEIADIIQKPIGTVASRINKAKKEFKKVFTQKYDRRKI